MSVDRTELIEYLESCLQTKRFRDYAPNGLQVEGYPTIKRLVTGVTASKALIDAAIEWEADAILVHHGYFWKGETPQLVGAKYQRIKALMTHDINLLGYHLPLDAHPQLGNNVQLATRLGIELTGPLDVNNESNVGRSGYLLQPCSAKEFAQRVESVLGRKPTLIQAGDHSIKTVGVCTGGAQGYIDLAIEQGLDAYISGEISEHTTHSARESGVHYIAAGHHATERYGVKALGEHLAEKFDIEQCFIDIDNPA